MDTHHEHDKSPSHTLDQIREGGVKVLAIAHSRLGEVEAALDRGEFGEALSRTQDLLAKLSALASAEAALGAMAHMEIVRAEDVTTGMFVHHGPVTDVEIQRTACASGGGDHVTVVLSWEDGASFTCKGDQELLVARTDDE